MNSKHKNIKHSLDTGEVVFFIMNDKTIVSGIIFAITLRKYQDKNKNIHYREYYDIKFLNGLRKEEMPVADLYISEKSAVEALLKKAKVSNKIKVIYERTDDASSHN